MKAAHDLDVKGLEGVASGLDEEHAGVDTVVDNVHAVDLVLRVEVGVVTLLNVVDNRAPGLIVVDEVSESRGVDHGQAKADASLFNVGADGLNGNRLRDDVQARSLALLGRVERSVEKSVDQGRLSESRFT